MPETNRIRVLLSERKVTLAEAALGAGIAEKTLRNAANGRPTHKSTRRLIAQYLGLEEEKIWTSNIESDYYSNAFEEPGHD